MRQSPPLNHATLQRLGQCRAWIGDFNVYPRPRLMSLTPTLNPFFALPRIARQRIRRYEILLSLILLALSFTVTPAAIAQEAEELLEPQRAFAFSTEAISAHTIAVTWQIAPGYYMYLDKFFFESDQGGPEISEVVFPPAKIKHDEFFGDVQILQGSARIILTLERTTEDSGQLNLTAKGQGCNEPVGVCYPPISHTLALDLPALTKAQTPASVSNVSDLRQLLEVGASESEFLDADDAFQLHITATDAQSLVAYFSIAPGYYLYQDKLRFSGDADDTLGAYHLPDGKTKHDPYFGDVQIYPTDFSVDLALLPRDNAQTIRLVAQYQGCADKGICYPPAKKAFTVSLPKVISDARAVTQSAQPLPAAESASNVALAGYLAAAFGTGLLLSFTPCVLPLIPILLGSVVGQSGGSRLRATALSVVYVLGTTATYAAIGAVAGATGDQLQAYFQNIWAIGVISLILTLMALSMFGLYEIQLPSALQSRLSTSSQHLGGSVGMIFALGALSALIVGACVSPLLISVLGIAILKGDAWLGAALMSAMALGMGVILIVAGTGASWLIPRSGPWMERVKQAFGVALLGVAIYLLGTVPEVPVLLLWATLLIITGIYLGAGRNVPTATSGWPLLCKGLGTVLLIWGVLAMIGGFSGNRNILAPVSLGSLMGEDNKPAQAPTARFTRMDSLSTLDRALATAQAANQPVVLDFYADWCTDCVRMEHSTFRDPAVISALAGYRLLQVDLTDPDDPGPSAIKKRYGVFGPPAMLFFDPSGDEFGNQRLYGYRGAQEFVTLLETL